MATKQDILNLNIHKLTQDQYDEAFAAGKIDPNAIYLTPEEVVDLSGYATVEELGEAVDDAVAAINNIISSKAGGTEVILNGTSKKGTTANIYAPVSAGTNGYILKSNGLGTPTWLQTLPVVNGGTGNNTLASGQALIGNGTGAIQTRAITDKTASALSSTSTNLITERSVTYAIANLVDSAPSTLNTLNKLAIALGENKNSITTILEEIGKKEDAITTLLIEKGGTGITVNPSMLVNLGSTVADTIFKASPRPGVTGTLGIANGGTGATTAAAALKNLGLTATAAELNYTDGVTSNIQTQLNDKVSKSSTSVQTIAGGLLIGGSYAASGTGKGRVVITGTSNPLFGLQAIDDNGNLLTSYYLQVLSDTLLLGPTSAKATSFDKEGNVSMPFNLTVKGDVTLKKPLPISSGGTGATTAAAARANLAASWCQTKTGTTSATAGWYRVAQTAVNIDNTMGTFEIKANISGYHSVTTLMAGTSFGISPSIQQLSHYAYPNTGISKARIVYHPTYSNNYAYLEIYQPQAVARSMTIKLTEGFGWTIIAPTAVSSIPTGYSNKEITLVSGKIVSDIIGANIQARSFDSKGVQENQIRVWHSENETDALYLFGNQDGRRGLYDMDIGSIISIGPDYVNFNSYRSNGAQWSKGRIVAAFKSTFVPDRTSDQYSGFYPILSRKTYSGSWDVGCLMPGSNAVNADGTYNPGDMPSGAHNKLYHEAFHFIHSYDSTYESGTHTAPLRIYGNGLVQAQKLGITTAGGYGTGNPPTGTADDPLFVGQLYFKIIE